MISYDEEHLVKVQLQIYWEQGMEGVEWSAHDNSKEGWNGFVSLNNGDYLEIPDNWAGIITADTKTNKEYPEHVKELDKQGKYRDILHLYNWSTKTYSDKQCKNFVNLRIKRQIVEGYICNWLQKDVNPNVWLSWFKDELIAYYCPKNYVY